jgi:hypothetical protein
MDDEVELQHTGGTGTIQRDEYNAGGCWSKEYCCSVADRGHTEPAIFLLTRSFFLGLEDFCDSYFGVVILGSGHGLLSFQSALS